MEQVWRRITQRPIPRHDHAQHTSQFTCIPSCHLSRFHTRADLAPDFPALESQITPTKPNIDEAPLPRPTSSILSSNAILTRESREILWFYLNSILPRLSSRPFRLSPWSGLVHDITPCKHCASRGQRLNLFGLACDPRTLIRC